MSRVSRYTVDVDDRGEWGGMAGGEGEGEGEGEISDSRRRRDMAGDMCNN